MGDRFYTEQREYKPKRVLKKDVIAHLINVRLKGIQVSGLDRLTIKTLEELDQAILDAYQEL